ncbi:FAD-binding protein [Trinickia violacea]|uniref:FAD-binding protein n=1 Tax=Trinickia violacea TaxID=2571746 RepID=A0A4P8J0Q7_9BURK|nr:FAD-dependent oxidoreductase [Trinickia violacea]QCP54337.1 FAD-binding protein [Trinickia violacea]
MVTARIAIVGGGLAGLYAAFVLEQQGIEDYVLLEARRTYGGRIESVSSNGTLVSGLGSSRNDLDRFDLGPTWFWPAHQPQLDRLIRELGLERFEQYETGHMVVERSPHQPPVQMRGYATSPQSMRLVGGMGALVDTLCRNLTSTRLKNDQQVRHIRRTGRRVELDAEDSHGQLTSYSVEHVLLAIPPRLAIATIDFQPALPDKLVRGWRDAATWMAPHAKYLAIYDTPFWRERQLSGEARSACGPLVEIHDASMPGASAGLFGFIGVPALARREISPIVLRALCRAQLERMFGPQAAEPRAEVIKDWAADALTATEADLDGTSHQHGAAPAASPASGDWRGRVVGIASEWSPNFSGYLAGAIEAADFGVHTLVEGLRNEKFKPSIVE